MRSTRNFLKHVAVELHVASHDRHCDGVDRLVPVLVWSTVRVDQSLNDYWVRLLNVRFHDGFYYFVV